MELKTCPNCKSPYLAEKKNCPRCGTEYQWNPESWANAGCLVLMIIVVLFFALMPILMICGMLNRW